MGLLLLLLPVVEGSGRRPAVLLAAMAEEEEEKERWRERKVDRGWWWVSGGPTTKDGTSGRMGWASSSRAQAVQPCGDGRKQEQSCQWRSRAPEGLAVAAKGEPASS